MNSNFYWLFYLCTFQRCFIFMAYSEIEEDWIFRPSSFEYHLGKIHWFLPAFLKSSLKSLLWLSRPHAGVQGKKILHLWCEKLHFVVSKALANSRETWTVLLGSSTRKKESRMAVAKRQRRERTMKIEQRKVPGLSEDLRWNKQPSWLAQFTQGRLRGGEKTEKEEPKSGQGVLFSSRILGWPTLMPQGCIFLCFLNKTEL